MAALGVTDHRFLGGVGCYRDSGMMGTPRERRAATRSGAPTSTRPPITWSRCIREIRPQVLVTYDEYGGYGHPDHIQAHRVATYAAAAGRRRGYRPDLGEAWDVPKIYWTAFPAADVDAQTARLEAAEAAGELPGGIDLPDLESYLAHRTCPDDAVAARIDGRTFVEQKKAAMAAHATQITVHGDLYALSNNLGALVLPVESYRLAKGRSGVPDGIEDDLFAGLD